MHPVARFFRAPVIMALLTGGWVSLFLVLDEGSAATFLWVLVPLATLSTFIVTTYPIAGTLLLLIASALSVVGGMHYGEIELFFPTVYVLSQLGRENGAPLLGIAGVVGCAVASAMRADAPAYGVLVSGALYGAAWLFGWIVRRRAAAAAAAARHAAELASVDLERAIESSTLRTRRRAADQALTLLRQAVTRMSESAVRAWQGAPPGWQVDIDDLRREGASAISRLHDTLALLDTGVDHGDRRGMTGVPSEAVGHGGFEADAAGRTPRLRVLWWVSGVVLLAASMTTIVLADSGNVAVFVAAVLLPVCAWASPRFPLSAGLLGAGAFAIAAVSPAAADPATLLPLAVAHAVLLWNLTMQSRALARVVLLVLIAAAIMLSVPFGRQGIGFMVVLSWLTVGAAVAWRERDEILHTEQARTIALTAGIAAAQLRADRAERRELARELHDGVSHGVTAMMLQAQAAQALGERDPERARRSIRHAVDLGERTLLEIDALADGRREHDERKGASFRALVDGARATGLRIAETGDVDVDALSYRIVQEALTNVTRYAPHADVVIESGVRDGQRFVRVSDSGAERGSNLPYGVRHALKTLGQGRGLRGLADRVTERGGEFHAGWRTSRGSDDGFEVHAYWPLDQGAPTPAEKARA